METLKIFVEEETDRAELLNQSIILMQKEVQSTKNDLEAKLVESTAYEKEILAVMNQMKQEVVAVKKKQNKTVSECNEKREVSKL